MYYAHGTKKRTLEEPGSESWLELGRLAGKKLSRARFRRIWRRSATKEKEAESIIKPRAFI